MKKTILLITLMFSLTTCFSQNTESDLLLETGIYKKRDGDFKGAILDYSKAIKLNPNKSDYYYFRANAKSLIGDFYGSLEDSNQSIKLNPTVAIYYFERGYSKHRLKDFQGAILDFTKSISLASEDTAKAESYLLRGFSKTACNKTREACTDFSKAGELGNEKAYDYIQKYCN
jgi:tetratricopeptide (TPR) repeat protein